jgi:N utilization substance protein B
MIGRRLLRIKILQILYAHFNTPDAGLLKPENELAFSVKKAYDLYFYLLLLPVAMKRYAESRMDIARNKNLPTYEDLHPNTRFTDNRLTAQLEQDKGFNSYLQREKLTWTARPELIKSLFLALSETEAFQRYMSEESNDYEKDRELLLDFFVNDVEDHELFCEIMEDQSIFWNDDLSFALTYAVKTLKAMQPDRPVPIPEMYKTDEDREFAVDLLRAVIRNYQQYEPLIEDNLTNWDMERVALLDKLILMMAVNELVEFPSIPIKVTFDEYLELAKYYSTAKSSIFINGLLDKISTDLQTEGKIAKFGRGLLE